MVNPLRGGGIYTIPPNFNQDLQHKLLIKFYSYNFEKKKLTNCFCLFLFIIFQKFQYKFNITHTLPWRRSITANIHIRGMSVVKNVLHRELFENIVSFRTIFKKQTNKKYNNNGKPNTAKFKIRWENLCFIIKNFIFFYFL